MNTENMQSILFQQDKVYTTSATGRPGVAIVFCLVLVMAIFSPWEEVFAKPAFQGKVIKVIDGDSVIVLAKNKKIEVRFYGIDSPEYDQPYSKKARRYVRRTLLGRKVTVAGIGHDRYSRLVAMVSDQNGTMINRSLVAEGLAWVHPGFCRKKMCADWKELEEKARSEKRNLWSGPVVIPPWKWKRTRKKRW